MMINLFLLVIGIAGVYFVYRSDMKDIRLQRCLDCNKPIQGLQHLATSTEQPRTYCKCVWKVYPPSP